MVSNTPHFDELCSIGRAEIKRVGEIVANIRKSALEFEMFDNHRSDKSEMIANATLAYRHMEDAAMRLGKAIQAYEGHGSIYDQNDAKRVAAAGPLQEQDKQA